MIKTIISLLLVSTIFCAYNVTKARKLAYVCASAFGTTEEINSWTCKYCSEYKLTNVPIWLLKTKAFNNSILDIFGFTGYSPEDNAIVVTFRSTVSIQNWIVDFDATQVNLNLSRSTMLAAKDVRCIKDSTMLSWALSHILGQKFKNWWLSIEMPNWSALDTA